MDTVSQSCREFLETLGKGGHTKPIALPDFPKGMELVQTMFVGEEMTALGLIYAMDGREEKGYQITIHEMMEPND